ncbi:MAG: hypothetical protein KGL39_30060 [Patescibacteria group bacterium]|nr:hypothetical protein [Patescibacteria group bacterium]
MGPNGERSQSRNLRGQLTGKPGSAYLTEDTGAFKLLICGADAEGLNLPNLGSLTVGGVTGSSPAYYSKVTIEGVPGYEPVPMLLKDIPCIVDPSAQESLFGSDFIIQNGLGVVIMGVKPADPSNPMTVQGQVRIAIVQGEWNDPKA